jgi:CRP-like cAMP-binding protein
MMVRARDPRIQTLSTMDVLAGASARELQLVCGLTTEVRIPAGKVLCHEGTRAHEVFLIVEGQVSVSRDRQALDVVGVGGIIGEMALVQGQARSATTTAVKDVTALVLSAVEFRTMLDQLPVVAANVRTLTAARQEANEQLAAS